jgi:hypothetical protein
MPPTVSGASPEGDRAAGGTPVAAIGWVEDTADILE